MQALNRAACCDRRRSDEVSPGGGVDLTGRTASPASVEAGRLPTVAPPKPAEEEPSMSTTGPLNGLPIACTLTPTAGEAQIERWRAFDDDYALGAERTDAELVLRYVKTEGSVARLRELVAGESVCCSFVDWTIDDSEADLRLIVAGAPDELAALTITRTSTESNRPRFADRRRTED